MRSNLLPARIQAVKTAIAATLVMAFSSAAGAMEPVSFPPAKDAVAFVVIKDSGEVPVTVPELEALGLYRVTTESPWEQGELTFEGVLFSEVVEYLGFEDASAVRIRALDDYSQDIPRQDWIGKPLILATRQDGEPLTRRTQGPTRLVYPLTEYPAYDAAVHDERWVWIIKSVERLD